MPSASVNTAARVNPGLFRSSLNPLRRSKRTSASHEPTPALPAAVSPARRTLAPHEFHVRLLGRAAGAGGYGRDRGPDGRRRAVRCYTPGVKRPLGNTDLAIEP